MMDIEVIHRGDLGKDTQRYNVMVDDSRLAYFTVYRTKMINMYIAHSRLHMDILAAIINAVREKLPAATSMQIRHIDDSSF